MVKPIKLKGLDILLTYECTGCCVHCCCRAGPGRNEMMTTIEGRTGLSVNACWAQV